MPEPVLVSAVQSMVATFGRTGRIALVTSAVIGFVIIAFASQIIAHVIELSGVGDLDQAVIIVVYIFSWFLQPSISGSAVSAFESPIVARPIMPIGH